MLHLTTDRLDALPGADYVATSIAVDRDDTWKTDHRLALQHGFPSVFSENGGPGGLSHTLRSVPPMLAVAKDVERLAPNALLLNYTNPENRVCLAIHRYSNVRTIGLCHGVADTTQVVARLFDLPLDDVELQAVGTNHFVWTTSLTQRSTGRDLLPLLRERLPHADSATWSFCTTLFDQFGVFPTTGDSHVGEYISYAAEFIGTKGCDFELMTRIRDFVTTTVDAWLSGSRPAKELIDSPSHESRLNHGATQIMAALIAGTTVRRPSFIIPNRGYVENLPEDAVIEVPGLIENGDFRGVPVGRLAAPVAAMVQREIAIEELAVEAAVTGSREAALQALLLDPCVHSARAAEAFLADILTAHRAHLPAFWS